MSNTKNRTWAAQLRAAGERLRDARGAMYYALDEAREAALEAIKDGYTESQVSRLLSVDRMTVRKWQGK